MTLRHVRTFVRAVLAFVGALAVLYPGLAHAQQYLPAASFHGASGIEGGAGSFQRARTRLRFALELRIDESPEDALVGAAIVDVEPKSAFGGELRYLRTLTPRIAVSAGALGYFVPATLFGPSAGVEVRIPIGKKTSFAVGPEAAVLALGSDLPDGIVIWQALLQGGLRVDL